MSVNASRRATVAVATALAVVCSAGTAAAVDRHVSTASSAPGRTARSSTATHSAATVTVAVGVAAHGTRRVRRPVHAVAHRTPSQRVMAAATTRSLRSRQRPARRTTRPRSLVVTGPTGWAALDAAIARIPSYHAGQAIWVVSSKFGHWGTADWYHATLYISPAVPTARLYDVAVHEWSHELSVLDYAGDVNAAVVAMNARFGGSDLTGAERAADCMALLQGAIWTHYTDCRNSAWRAAAARLVSGRPL